MSVAGREECELAIQQNDLDNDKVPTITVVVDAGWSKRAHRHMYNALSGVGVIFGLQTGKLLYIGVRNKYCAACQKDANKKHVCFKNWEEASSSMETGIILAGFKVVQAQHGEIM